MGRDEAVTKKLVLGKVQEAVDAANGAIKAVGIVTRLHNQFVEKMEKEVSRLDADTEAVAVSVGVERERLNAFVMGLTFWQRLRWFCLGDMPNLPLSTPRRPSPSDFDLQARKLADLAEQDSRVAPI